MHETAIEFINLGNTLQFDAYYEKLENHHLPKLLGFSSFLIGLEKKYAEGWLAIIRKISHYLHLQLSNQTRQKFQDGI